MPYDKYRRVSIVFHCKMWRAWHLDWAGASSLLLSDQNVDQCYQCYQVPGVAWCPLHSVLARACPLVLPLTDWSGFVSVAKQLYHSNNTSEAVTISSFYPQPR